MQGPKMREHGKVGHKAKNGITANLMDYVWPLPAGIIWQVMNEEEMCVTICWVYVRRSAQSLKVMECSNQSK
jgi:hypothetical protein